MNRTGNDDRHEPAGLPAMEDLLRYRQHLDGDEFTRRVVASAGRRARARPWILGGAAAAGIATVVAIRPERFTLFDAVHWPWHGVDMYAASVPAAGLLAMSIVLMLVIGTGKTIDSI